jgi:hypothetical protein
VYSGGDRSGAQTNKLVPECTLQNSDMGGQSASGKQEDGLAQKQVIRELPQQRRKKSRHAFFRRRGDQQECWGMPDFVRGVRDELIGQVMVRTFWGGKIDRVDSPKFDCSLFKDWSDGSKQKTWFGKLCRAARER